MTLNGPQWFDIDEREVDAALNDLFLKKRQQQEHTAGAFGFFIFSQSRSLTRLARRRRTGAVLSAPRCSGALLPPSPPAEKASARQHQAGKASTDDGAGDEQRGRVRCQ
jgi:hypothetical protein